MPFFYYFKLTQSLTVLNMVNSEFGVFNAISKKGNDNECSNYDTTTLISNVSKVMLKILQARLQLYVN